MKKLITPAEAFELIQTNWPELKTELIPIQEALNRTLAESVFADRDQPPFNRVMMDGFAINSKDWKLGTRAFIWEGIQAAGAAPKTRSLKNSCIEIMTGSVLPENCDAVIPYEKSNRKNNNVEFEIDEVTFFMNIHSKGQDKKKGQELLTSGVKIGPIEIGVLAACGVHKIKVFSKLKMAIVSTGDELVAIHEAPNDYQIRSSNKETLASLFELAGLESSLFHLPDNTDLVEQFVTQTIKNFDLICLSGGVSMGKYDFIPSALERLNAKTLFHGIAQKPGKPMLACTLKNKLVIGLPGNPVSALLGATRYILPLLEINRKEMQGVILNEIIKNNSSLFLYKPAVLKGKTAHLISQNGSGDFMGILGMDGFVEIPPMAHDSENINFNFYPIR
jgi:molybdopterin molybdotransferase